MGDKVRMSRSDKRKGESDKKERERRRGVKE